MSYSSFLGIEPNPNFIWIDSQTKIRDWMFILTAHFCDNFLVK